MQWFKCSMHTIYRKSYERECISWFMGASDVLKVPKIWELQNITSNHKPQNAQASSYDILFIIFSKIKRRCFNDYRVFRARTLRVSYWFFIQSTIFANFLTVGVGFRSILIFCIFFLFFNIVLVWQSKNDCRQFCFCFQLWRLRVRLFS